MIEYMPKLPSSWHLPAYGLRVAIGRNDNDDCFATNVETSSSGMDTSELVQALFVE
jgi:hypothetical protein